VGPVSHVLCYSYVAKSSRITSGLVCCSLMSWPSSGFWGPHKTVEAYCRFWAAQILDIIAEIQERHDAVRDIEKKLLDLHQVALLFSVVLFLFLEH